MAESQFPNQSIDPELERQLKRMRSVPPRDPEMVARNTARFIAEVDDVLQARVDSHNAHNQGKINFYQRWKEKWNMATPQLRTVVTLAAVFVTLFVFLFGGAGMTALASQAALPGDALYGVKTGVEQTRVSLARDAAQKARLNLAFAERRLDEMSRLIAEGRYADISQAVEEYERYVQDAIASLEIVAGGDPAGAQELTAQVASSLRRYAETLAGMAGALPEAVRSEVERAIQFSGGAGSFKNEIEFYGTVEEITADYWVVDGRQLMLSPLTKIEGMISIGSMVKVQVWQDADGSLVLREAELDDDDMNANENDNGNENDDDGNENDDDGNENDDVNENDDDGNENDDANDNDNDVNDNDDGNENDDVNENDDDGNENDDGNDNDDDGNENDDVNENDDDGNDNDDSNDNDDMNENDDSNNNDDDSNDNDDDDSNDNDDDDSNDNDDDGDDDNDDD